MNTETEATFEWVNNTDYPYKPEWYLRDRSSGQVLIRVSKQYNLCNCKFWVICKANGIQTDLVYDSLESAKYHAEKNHAEINGKDYEYSISGRNIYNVVQS